MDKFDQLVGQIYDCAANPDLWTETLVDVRDYMNAAYVLASVAEYSPANYNAPPHMIVRHSPWDVSWFQSLGTMMHKIIGQENLVKSEIDEVWIQSQQAPMEVIEKSEFYQNWAKPQGLIDCINIGYIKRNTMQGVVSMPCFEKRGVFTSEDGIMAERLSPHIRRAMMINDVVDKGKLALALYRQVLDSIATPVFVMGLGHRIVFCNAPAEQMLVEAKFLKNNAGLLSVAREGNSAKALEEAIDRCAKGHADCGTSGIGVPLVDDEGDRAAAYVLPIGGSDLRGDLGKGFAAVFVSKRSEQQPMVIEVLRTIFDLTPAEARVSTLIAKGDDPTTISEALNVSVNTIRTHLARVFQKTGARDQLALSTVVNQLLPPIT